MSGLVLAACESGDGEPPVATSSPDPTADAAFADLANDTLIAPDAPTLDIAAEPGALTFRWDAPLETSSRVRLLERDAHDAHERALDLTPSADTRGARLPVAAHRLAWSTVTWRIEHCDTAGCVSSRRTRAAADAALATAHEIAPAVAITGERFGERIAMNAGGTLLVVASPVAGRIALHDLRDDGPAIADPPPRLEGPASITRALDAAVSANGDVIAVMSGDAARGRDARVLVFERLGEGWITTANEPVLAARDVALGRDGARPRVILSADGERLLVACTGAPACPVVEYLRTDTGWQAGRLVHAPLDDELVTHGVPLAIDASATLERIAVATSRAGETPRLQVHDIAGSPTRDATVERISLPALAADAPLALALDDGGAHVAIGGLEPSAAASPAPVLWRYRIDRDGASLALHVEDSLRLASPPDRASALSLAADATLDTVAFGWSTVDAAALVTHVSGERGWRPALELPGDADRLAGRPFGEALALDANGATFALDIAPAASDPTTAPSIGRVLLTRASGTATTLERHLPHATP